MPVKRKYEYRYKTAYGDDYSDFDGKGCEPQSHHCFVTIDGMPEQYSTDIISFYQFRHSDFLITELDEFEMGALADPYRARAGRASVLHRYKAGGWTSSLSKPLTFRK